MVWDGPAVIRIAGGPWGDRRFVVSGRAGRYPLGGAGEMTNEDEPGLGPGNKWVFTEDNKKAYVSVDINGRVNGVAWEGFGGK
jgi:hypothetical protein